MLPGTAPAMTTSKTQLPVAPDAQSTAVPDAVTNTAIPITSLIAESAFCVSLKNMIVGLATIDKFAHGR